MDDGGGMLSGLLNEPGTYSRLWYLSSRRDVYVFDTLLLDLSDGVFPHEDTLRFIVLFNILPRRQFQSPSQDRSLCQVDGGGHITLIHVSRSTLPLYIGVGVNNSLELFSQQVLM